VGAAALKMSTDFNESMADVASLIPRNTKRINELKKSVQDAAIATGTSTAVMSKGLYQLVSAFGDSAETAQNLDLAARAAKAGLATVPETINLLSAVTKGYGDVSFEAQQKASDLAFVTVKLGQTTFPELAAAIGRVIPTAAKLNVAQEELFAGFATLTGVTGNAAEVSTQLAGVLRAMMKPTEEMTGAITQLGNKMGFVGAEQMLGRMGLVPALKALIGTTDGSVESVGKLFGRAEALNAVFALTGSQAETFNTKLDAMGDSAGATAEAFKEQTEGVNAAGFAWEQVKVQVTVIAQKLGDVLAPILQQMLNSYIKPLLGYLESWVKWFKELSSGTQTIITGALALTAALGPLLLALGFMVTNLSALLPIMGKVGASSVLLTGQFTALATAGRGLMTVLAGPIGLVALAGAAAFAFAKLKVEADFRKFRENISEPLKEAVAGAAAMTETSGLLRQEILKLVPEGKTFVQVWSKIAPQVHQLVEKFKKQEITQKTLRYALIRLIKTGGEAQKLVGALDIEFSGFNKTVEDSSEHIIDVTKETGKLEKALSKMGAEVGYLPPIFDRTIRKVGLLDNLMFDSSSTVGDLTDAVRDHIHEQDLLSDVAADSSQAISDWAAGLEPAGEKVKSFGETISKQVSTIVTDFSKGIVDIIFKWEGMWESMIAATKELGKALLRSVVETLVQPFIERLAGIASGWISKLFGGGGSGGIFKAMDPSSAPGVLGALFGGGGGGGGGMPIGIPSFDPITALINFGGSFLGNFLGGLAQGKSHGFDIMANTSSILKALVGPVGVIDIMHSQSGILWHLHGALTAPTGVLDLLSKIRWFLFPDLIDAVRGHQPVLAETTGGGGRAIDVSFEDITEGAQDFTNVMLDGIRDMIAAANEFSLSAQNARQVSASAFVQGVVIPEINRAGATRQSILRLNRRTGR
jgi:TP901 family phage tail tape measure protein